MKRRILAIFLAIFMIVSALLYLPACSKPAIQVIGEDQIQLPIIMYHGVLIDKEKSGKFIITPKEFEEDLKYIKANNFTTITIKDLTDYLYSDKPLPEKPIMITLDDGYLNNYAYVFPLLKKYKMKAVLSIIGIRTDEDSQSEKRDLYTSHVSWKDIKEMVASGFIEVQNHSYNLHILSDERRASMILKGETLEDYEYILNEDIGKLQQIIYEQTGNTPVAFTYPYGLISPESTDIIKKMGFFATLSCREGINLIDKNPECLFQLKRYNRPHGISTKKFFNKRLLSSYVDKLQNKLDI